MIVLLLLLLLAFPLIGLLALFAAPLVGLLAVIAAPAIAVLAVVAVPALAIAGLAGALPSLSAPVLGTLEVLGIAVGVFGVIAALAYAADRFASRTQVPALRPREVPVRVRGQNMLQPQRQAAVSVTRQTIPADLAAQCQGLQSVPCPV
jgi:hypothetical protein